MADFSAPKTCQVNKISSLVLSQAQINTKCTENPSLSDEFSY